MLKICHWIFCAFLHGSKRPRQYIAFSSYVGLVPSSGLQKNWQNSLSCS